MMDSIRLTAILAFTSFISLTSWSEAAEKPTHLFILSGQSNMAGMNPKLGFEPELKKQFPNAETDYIKVAVGGRPIRLWLSNDWNAISEKYNLNKPQDSVPENSNYYAQILSQYKKMLQDHPEPTSVTFCWMQGERDSREKLSSAYEEALNTLISNLRRDLEQPEMNFVIGRLSDFDQGATSENWEAVRQAQMKVANDDPHGAWVDCDDLNNKSKGDKTWDDLHYTQEGYELLGRRYVRQAKALIEGKKPAADGRPE